MELPDWREPAGTSVEPDDGQLARVGEDSEQVRARGTPAVRGGARDDPKVHEGAVQGLLVRESHALGSVARGCQDQELELVSLAKHHVVGIGSTKPAPNRVRHRRGAHHLVHHEARAVVSPDSPVVNSEAVAVSVGVRARMRVNRHRVAGCFLLPVASHSALRRRLLASIRRRCGLSHRRRGFVTFRSSRRPRVDFRQPGRRNHPIPRRGESSTPDQRRVTLGRLRSAALFGSPQIARWASRCVHFAVCAPPRQDLRREGQRSTSRTVTTLSREPGSRPRIPPRP